MYAHSLLVPRTQGGPYQGLGQGVLIFRAECELGVCATRHEWHSPGIRGKHQLELPRGKVGQVGRWEHLLAYSSSFLLGSLIPHQEDQFSTGYPLPLSPRMLTPPLD